MARADTDEALPVWHNIILAQSSHLVHPSMMASMETPVLVPARLQRRKPNWSKQEEKMAPIYVEWAPHPTLRFQRSTWDAALNIGKELEARFVVHKWRVLMRMLHMKAAHREPRKMWMQLPKVGVAHAGKEDRGSLRPPGQPDQVIQGPRGEEALKRGAGRGNQGQRGGRQSEARHQRLDEHHASVELRLHG